MSIDSVRRDPIGAASVKRKVSADCSGASPTMNSIGFGEAAGGDVQSAWTAKNSGGSEGVPNREVGYVRPMVFL